MDNFDDEEQFFLKEQEEKLSSILEKSRGLDSSSLDFFMELLKKEIEDNKEELIISKESRNITILQGKILGQREILKVLEDIRSVKGQF